MRSSFHTHNKIVKRRVSHSGADYGVQSGSVMDDFPGNTMQVFKPLYYWDEARHAVMREPSRFLVQDGLAGRAFMLHPFKLSGADAAKAFWQVHFVTRASHVPRS